MQKYPHRRWTVIPIALLVWLASLAPLTAQWLTSSLAAACCRAKCCCHRAKHSPTSGPAISSQTCASGCGSAQFGPSVSTGSPVPITAHSLPALRWSEGAPGCTLRIADDGHTYYSVSTVDFQLTLTVDNQELEKIRHRTIPMIGVLLSFNYKGTDPVIISPSQSTLEFSKHFQVVQQALDPDSMLQQLQQNIDDLTDEVTRHQIKKHPEQKTEKETELQQRLKDYTEMMDFISTHALRGETLDTANSSLSGWVFFNTKNRWIGPWRRPEQFVLRIQVNNALVEFPFELPPKGRKVQLRTRPPQ